MTFTTALLTHRQQLKIQLFMLTKESPTEFDLAGFAAQKQLNYAKAYNLLMAISQDLIQAGYQVQMRSGKVITNATLDDYRRFLYHSTIAYQCLWSCLQNEFASAEAFCQAKKISSSTLQRHLQPLKKYLHQLNLRFSPQNFTILGNEVLIQTFFYQFLTVTLTKLPTNSQTLPWQEKLLTNYQNHDQSDVPLGLKQQRNLWLNLSLLRLKQGFTLPKMVYPLPIITNHDSNQIFLEKHFELTTKQAHHFLNTLDYLLTASPFFNGRLTFLGAPKSPPFTTTDHFKVHDSGYSRATELESWLYAIAYFIINFGVDPLLQSISQTNITDSSPVPVASSLIRQLETNYHLDLSERQLRILDQKLAPYINLVNRQNQFKLLIGQELQLTAKIWSTKKVPILTNWHLLDLNKQPPFNNQQTIVVYSSDVNVLAFAQQYQLPIFHWIHELGITENLKRLVDWLYTLKLGDFAQ